MLLEKLSRKLLNPYYHKHCLSSPNAFRLYDKYLTYEKMSLDELKTIQFTMLKKLLIHAGDNTAYYAKLFKEVSFNPHKFDSMKQLEMIPSLSKEKIIENEREILAGNYDDASRHSSSSGGTSGVLLKFYRDNDCRSHRVAFQWRSDAWTGWTSSDKVVYVWPALDDISQLDTFKQKLINRYITGFEPYSASYLNDKVCGEIAQSISKFKPMLVRCFPSPATIVAQYIVDNNISLPSVKAVISTGEPLYPHQREILEQAYKCKVYNLYAAREVGTIAAECKEHKELHVAMDSLALEVTKDNRQLSVGEDGELLITDLLNYGFPMIRYEINDRARMLDKTCECGLPFPLMENVVGRTVDTFLDSEGNRVATIVFAMHLVHDSPPPGKIQIIQNTVTDFTIRLTIAPDEKLKKFYEDVLKRVIKCDVNVTYDLVEKIEAEQSGKFRFTINRIPNQ